MSTHLQRKLEDIEHILECLIEESLKGTPIIVEGKKDVQTLRELGVRGKIVTVKTAGKSRLDVVLEIEESDCSEIILLLDFDRRGREWTEKLRQDLEKAKIKPNVTFWKKLFAIAGKELKDVEGLVAYLQTLKKKGELKPA